jgi:hypothetical protein
VEKTKEKANQTTGLKFTSKDILRQGLYREFSGESEEDSAMTKNDLFKEGMEFLSTMYRVI